ncbi:hypothetical protein LL033_08260 [Clostridium estertheticum]|uniref:hypothetical protein n=1 Tax=Clostridium estertheticum TaxID=238834 RepID=UPI001C0D627C|nr:hypothetical protein [Clostridium estertheticum]MBU3214802.1 hypothetical protein [Clostridium estertheticum]WAG57212.1 hypothetical protein LL033_08260 [Clostridium estertheticum]
MPLMYLGKVNLNSRIFDVYENKLDLNIVLEEIYNKLDVNKIYTERKKVEYSDSFGNKKSYTKVSNYQFNDLKKELGCKIITGKILRTFQRPSENLDKKTGKLTNTYINVNVSIYFYFDVKRELITFSTRQSFGYNQFTNAFNNLLNMTVDSYGFEVFLQKDEDILSEKIKSFKRISKVTATLIPPNANEEDLNEFRKSLGYIGECQESNARKFKLELIDSEQEPGLNMEAKIMRDTIKAVGRGYGDMTTYGINHSDRAQVMKSNQDAALTCVVNENIAEDEYNNEAGGFIARFVANLIAKRAKGAS